MTSERIKEIQATTGYPDSVSIKQALLQVWNECEQSHPSPMSAEQVEDISKTIFASIDHYREAGRDDEFNIKSIAEYLQRHFATTPSVKADGWVSVEDELPKVGQKVDLWLVPDDEEKSYRMTWTWEKESTARITINGCKVTHWQPFTPPKQHLQTITKNR